MATTPSTPSTSRQSYAGLDQFQETGQRTVIQQIMGRLNTLEGKAGVARWSNTINAGGNTLTGLRDPTDGTDAVTKAYLEAHYSARVLRLQFQVGGSAPINITSLLGSAGQVRVGQHADRVQRQGDPAGTIFYELDRYAIYIVEDDQGTYRFAQGIGEGLSTSLPGDLGVHDVGYKVFGIDTGIIYEFSGNIWHVNQGMIVDALANRPVAFVGVDSGVLFQATDHGNQVWRLDFVGAWVLQRGLGDPTANLIANITGGLGVHDAGYRFYATDYDRVYEWDGGAWGDAPGSPSRFQYVSFPAGAPDRNGWIVANGVAQTRSTSTGGAVGFTPSNIANTYVRV